MVDPEPHSSLYVTSGTQQEMSGVMCLDKIEFAQRYLKIHCKSTLVQMRIEPGSSLSEVNTKIRGEWIACCWKIPCPAAESSSFLPHPVTTEELNISQSLRVKSCPQWNQKDFFCWPQWGQDFTHSYSIWGNYLEQFVIQKDLGKFM